MRAMGRCSNRSPTGRCRALRSRGFATYAKRHGTREIPIGDSAAEFLRLMDMDAQGARYQGKNADKDFKREFLKCLRAVLAVYP